MEKSRELIRLFGVVQGVVLAAIIGAIYLHWKRTKERERSLKEDLDQINIRPEVKRQAVYTASPAASSTQSRRATGPQIESAFPDWDKNTPAQEVLQVSLSASVEDIEAAYKKQLKKFHPDLYAHWGKGYQKRAHHVVLMLQKARDMLLKKK